MGMKTAYSRVCLASIAIASLTGCGISSTSGGVSATVQPNFTTWSNSIVAGKTVVVAGDSQQGTYSFVAGNVTARTVEAQQPGALLTLVFTETIPALSSFYTKDFRLQTASGTYIKFNRVDDTFFSSSGGTYSGFESADKTKVLMMAEVNLFEYQSYGIWTTGIGTASGTYGAVSVGSPSPAAAIPTQGVATYTGSAGGRHVDAAGPVFFATAQMSTSVDFFKRELYFRTSNTSQSPNPVADFYTGNNTLDMTGTLNIVPGTNQFRGAVTTGNGMTGTATGRFYGAAIQEIGGTFSTTGAGVQSYSGAFGGVKQ